MNDISIGLVSAWHVVDTLNRDYVHDSIERRFVENSIFHRSTQERLD